MSLQFNKLYFGDCLDLMPCIDDKSIDLIVCDLPFGVTAADWDSIINFGVLWKEYNRVIKKDGMITLFSSQPFTTKLIVSNEENFKYCWYWIKNQGTNFFHAKRMPIRKVEEICIFGGRTYFPQISEDHKPTNSTIGESKGRVYFGKNKRNDKGGKTTRYPTNVLNFKCVDNYSRLHPNEKPLELCEYLINTYSRIGDTVLDNCMGSGTTCLAAKNTGRNFIGIEKVETYFNIATQRLN